MKKNKQYPYFTCIAISKLGVSIWALLSDFLKSFFFNLFFMSLYQPNAFSQPFSLSLKKTTKKTKKTNYPKPIRLFKN